MCRIDAHHEMQEVEVGHCVQKMAEELSCKNQAGLPSLCSREKVTRHMQSGAIDEVCSGVPCIFPPGHSDAKDNQGKLVHPILSREVAFTDALS